MTTTYYIDEDGGRHSSLPTLWKNRTPMNWTKLQRLGWTIHQEEVPDPPKTYSRYKLKRKLAELGIWEDVKAAIEQYGYWDSLVLITRLESTNDELQRALPLLQEAFPNVDVDEILNECVE